MKYLALFSFLVFSFNGVFAQSDLPQNFRQTDKQLQLKSSLLSTGKSLDVEINTSAPKSKKSAGVAFLLSLVLPGAGHLYLDRMDVGKYFVGFETLNWLGIAGLNIYGDAVRKDARTFAQQHSGLSSEGKDDDFYVNVGGFNNVYDYNNDKLATGEYEKVYDVNSFYWNWDTQQSRDNFEAQRKRSERMYNTTVLFATGLVINRIASAISALIMTNSQNSGSGIRVNTELTKDYNNNINGLRLNLVKNF